MSLSGNAIAPATTSYGRRRNTQITKGSMPTMARQDFIVVRRMPRVIPD